MLDNESFIVQSINSNLYYLRTIREFCISLQLAFLDNNKKFISKAKELGEKCEELGLKVLSDSNNRISKEANDNQIFYTDYTLDVEKLTEKLFPIEINTIITENEIKLNSGVVDKVDEKIVNEFNLINNEAENLVQEFIEFCKSIIKQLENNNLFTYLYKSLIEAFLIETNLYKLNLERLREKSFISPTFVANYEYLFNSLFQKCSSFIRGLVDPDNKDVFVKANSFYYEMGLLVDEYKSSSMSPETQFKLTDKSIEVLGRFSSFLKEILKGILDKKMYFITSPIIFDNMLTSVNYFVYSLKTEK